MQFTKKIFSLFIIILLSFNVTGQTPTPLIQYDFEHQLPADKNQIYTGVLHGNAEIVTMTDGNNVLFTGAGHMDIGAEMGKTVLAELTGSYSISIDFSVGNANSLSSFCWLYAFANGTNQYIGLINTAGNNNWYYEIRNNSTQNVRSNTGISIETWHNITYVQNGAVGSIYLDGVLKNSGTIGLRPSAFSSLLTGCYLGLSPYSGDATMSNTFIDNFTIYNTTLSASQISEIYNNIKDKSVTPATPIISNITKFWESKGNPIITHKYTCDPAALVYNDTLFIYTGQDAAGGQSYYNINNWAVFATTDMKNFWEYSTPLRASDFTWGTQNAAWAGQVIEKNGKFYWYTSSNTTGIGVAVSDRPEGPFKDALGKPLLTNANSPGMSHSWRTIDPSVFIDDDGQAWLYWGNGACWVSKLNPDMISIDSNYGVKMISFAGHFDFPFTEAPWVHKKNGLYYLSYAAGFPERIQYAISTSPDGPFENKGIINEIAGNSNTNHQAIVEYKGNWYFIYHNGGIQTDGGSFSRSVCIDKLEFDENNLYKPIIMTTKGVDKIESTNDEIIKAEVNSADNPFYYDRGKQLIHMKNGNNYQIADSLGHIVKSGNGKKVSVMNFAAGVYIISNGSKSFKFIR